MRLAHARNRLRRFGTAVVLAAVAAPSSTGQQAPGGPNPLPPYRPPALALVQPAAGGSVPGDRPILVFRFVAGEQNDPVDVRSFRITVDGKDRTTLFQTGSAEAWGPLDSLPNGQDKLDAGTYQVIARLCSAKGVCTEISALVTVAVSAVSPTERSSTSRKRSVIDLVLSAARKLLQP